MPTAQPGAAYRAEDVNVTALEAELEKSLASAMEQMAVPGAAVTVASGDGDVMLGAGITNLEHPLAVDVDTLFSVASVTKSVVATAVVKMTELGLLELAQPVQELLPELKLGDAPARASLTVHDLLTHSAGWADDWTFTWGGPDDTIAAAVTAVSTLPQVRPPGVAWSYGNSAFIVLGRIIEVLLGAPFHAGMRELVFEPVGMASSWFRAQDVLTHRVAAGHAAGAVVRPWIWDGRAYSPAVGLITSARDLLTYARVHLGPGDFLSSQSVQLMRTPVLPSDRHRASGLGWITRSVDDSVVLAHGGQGLGQQSLVTLVPAADWACVVLTNGGRGGEVARDVTRGALHSMLGIRETDPVGGTVPSELISEYSGLYRSGAMEAVVSGDGDFVSMTVRATNLTLLGPTPPPTRLGLVEHDWLAPAGGVSNPGQPGVEFFRDAEGRVTSVRVRGILLDRVTE